MSIATIVTRGFGSFGSVSLLPTLGYSIAAVVIGPFRIVASLAYSAGADAALGNSGGATASLGNSGGASNVIGHSAGADHSLGNSGGAAAVQGIC